jgi:hypothetical protein
MSLRLYRETGPTGWKSLFDRRTGIGYASIGSRRCRHVNKRILLGIGLIAVLTPLPAFTQAAAESALINSLSSSSTIKAGSALNHALNQGSAQLGARIQERTSGPMRIGVQKSTPWPQGRNQIRQSQVRPSQKRGNLSLSSGSTPSAGTIFIHGGEVACAPASTIGPSSPAKPNSGSAATDCHGKGSTSNSGNQDQYRSFVTLSPSKQK